MLLGHLHVGMYKINLLSSQQVKHSSATNTLRSAEVKLIAIPIVFIVLRFWSFLLVEMTINSSEGTLSCDLVLALLFIAVSLHTFYCHTFIIFSFFRELGIRGKDFLMQ